MKRTLSVLLALAGLASVTATPAAAQIAGLSANAAVTSDYVFRGISQSAKRAALQGGLDYAVPDTGIAIGTWASSIDFGDATGHKSNTPVEWDIYGNYNFMAGPLNASLGVYSYVYLSSPVNYNVFEIDGGLSHDFGFMSWSAKANWAPTVPKGYVTIREGYNPKSEFWLTTGLAAPIAKWLSVSGNVGYQGYVGRVPHFSKNDSYVEWDLGATLTYDKYSLDLRYVDTSRHTFGFYKYPYFSTGPFFVATFSFKFP